MNRDLQQKILDETWVYYMEDPSRRSVSEDQQCLYIYNPTGDDEHNCAVGRCLNDKTKDFIARHSEHFNHNGYCKLLSNLKDLFDYDEPIFKEEYKGCHKQFWVDLQILHDSVYWLNEDKCFGHMQLKRTYIRISEGFGLSVKNPPKV